MAIQSVKDKFTARVLSGDFRKVPADLINRLQDKILSLNGAASLDDLRIPTSNRLKLLEGEDIYSIRVNRQWRICFRWTDNGPEDVEISNHYGD